MGNLNDNTCFPKEQLQYYSGFFMKNTVSKKVVLIFITLTLVMFVLSSCSPGKNEAVIPDQAQAEAAYRQAVDYSDSK
jgi:hypothetical protein